MGSQEHAPAPQGKVGVLVMKLRKNIEVHAVDARAELWRHHDERAYGQVEEQVAGTLERPRPRLLSACNC